MNKIYKKSLFLLLILPALNYAQVGISNSAPKAQLDISASNQASPASTDGILIPRLNAFPGTNPGADQNAMIVYLNVASGSNPIGFYYWNNPTTSWLPFGGGGTTNGWDILGNAGTVNGTNFLGTTDAQALEIRTNNVIRARITTKGQIEILNTGRSVFLGNGAGANDDLGNRENTYIGNTSGNASTTGVINVGVGSGTLSSITTTSKNVAVGSFAMSASTSATSNVAIGTQSLQKSNGDFNTGIGQQVLANLTTGNKNVAIGAYAGLNINDDDNVSIGHEADKDNNGGTQNVTIGSGAGASSGNKDNDGNVLIGYNAAKNIATDNSLYIENSSSVTPLIYGEFDNNIVRIGGQLQVGSSDNATVGSIYAFPTVDGTVGQALITDGGGNVSWGTVAGGGADTQDLSIVDGTGTISLVDGGSVNVSTIADADADTKIQVEESADEDVIRFDIKGAERFSMDEDGRISTYAPGDSMFIGEGSGANDDLTDNRNLFIGKNSGAATTTGEFNTAIGYEALQTASSAPKNVRNVVMGYQALQTGTKGYNVVIGTQAGQELKGGSNVLIGDSAGKKGNSNNVAIGFQTYRNNTWGSLNTIVGNQAGNMSIGHSNTSLGSNTLAGYGGELIYNVAVGRNGLSGLENGEGNTAIGFDSLGNMLNGTFNIALGYEAGEQVLSNSTNNIFLGTNSGGATLFTNSILIGKEAGGFEGATASNRLVIEPSSSNTPLIGGDFATNKVGINVNLATAGALSHTLTVNGDVKATNYFATASNTNYADYVFEDYFGKEATINTKYNFTPLKEAVKFVEENGHLPNVKSYKEIKANNFEISLKETSLKNLEKIEENFLYIKEINEKNEALEKENKELKALLNNVIERLEKLESK